MTFNANERDNQKWFSLAIKAGHLSNDRAAKNYVGFYEFRGTRDGIVYFQNSRTKDYHNIEADKLINQKTT